ncbi:MAG TPA: crossover junction endodeoxyribonuclease RuvC [Ignavibacteria bacterium]|nr:crossover junction endodeoxyribonuclease RuvC [Ignavibacteria bacterium]
MRIIGIDPGTTITGIGIVDCMNSQTELIYHTSVNLNKKDSLPERLKIIYDRCLECIVKYKPDEFAIETAFYGKNIQSTLKLGQARGVAIIAALNSSLKVSEYSPREIKKSITGNGASSKEQVQYMVKTILSLKNISMTVDSSDAIAIALCHLHSVQNYSGKNGSKMKAGNSWKSYAEKNPDRIISNKLK